MLLLLWTIPASKEQGLFYLGLLPQSMCMEKVAAVVTVSVSRHGEGLEALPRGGERWERGSLGIGRGIVIVMNALVAVSWSWVDWVLVDLLRPLLNFQDVCCPQTLVSQRHFAVIENGGLRLFLFHICEEQVSLTVVPLTSKTLSAILKRVFIYFLPLLESSVESFVKVIHLEMFYPSIS